MSDPADVVVVGGGPAGSTLALTAAAEGLRVVLLDKARFPRDKVCGDAIPPSCLEVVRALGLEGALLARPHRRIATMLLTGERGRLRAPVPKGGCLVCRRADFDDVLLAAAREAVDVREGWRVEGLLRDGAGRARGVRGVRRDGPPFEVAARRVVGADGFGSVVARAAGLFAARPAAWAVATRAYFRGVAVEPGTIELHFFSDHPPGYLWVFPVDEAVVNTGAVVFGRPGQAKRGAPVRRLHEEGLRRGRLGRRFRAAEAVGRLRGWNLPLTTARAPLLAGADDPDLLLAGDAASLVDPLWGHGIDTAMLSGRILGRLLGRAARGEDTLARYPDRLRERVGAMLARDEATSRALRSFPASVLAERLPALLQEVHYGGRGTLEPLPDSPGLSSNGVDRTPLDREPS